MQAINVNTTEWQIINDSDPDNITTETFFGRVGMTETEVLAAFDEARNPPAPTAAEQAAALLASSIAAIDAMVEDTAKARDYNSAAHLASYVSSTVPAWSSEAAAFVAWRDQVWQAAYALLAQVEAGEIAPPTPAGAVAEMPGIVWP